MRRRIVFRAVVLTASFGMLASGIASAQEQQGTISGRVTDAAIGAGVVGG
jgi:hypothetical protein